MDQGIRALHWVTVLDVGIPFFLGIRGFERFLPQNLSSVGAVAEVGIAKAPFREQSIDPAISLVVYSLPPADEPNPGHLSSQIASSFCDLS
jgi:hypothetical protein